MVTGPESDRAGGKGMGWYKKPLQRAMHILTKDCFNLNFENFKNLEIFKNKILLKNYSMYKILKGFSINENFPSITQ